MRHPAAILAILDEEHRLCTRLLDVAEAQRVALLAGDVEALAPTVRELEGLSRRIDGLEKQRLAHVAAITGGRPGANPGFGALAEFFEGAERDRLACLGEALQASLLRVRIVNDANAALIRQAQTLATDLARTLKASLPKTYAPSGEAIAPRPLVRSWSA
jgi:flagellar biosynthesis/type III secretory pathway chaperone